MVFLEAAACGKPVVAGTAGGTGSAVLDKRTGLRVDGDSLLEIANAITILLTDGARAHAMGTAGGLRARAEFSWDAVAERINTLPERSEVRVRNKGEAR